MQASALDQFVTVESEDLDGSLSERVLVDGINGFAVKAQKIGGFMDRRIKQQRLFQQDVLVMRPSTLLRILQGEEILFESLGTELTGKEKVIPIVSEPVIPGPA